MPGASSLLDGVLIILLAVTLFHALRLERALGVLKRDRGVLEALVEGFNDSTRQAEAGIERLRVATDGAGRQIARQIETAQRLRDDLNFLGERGDRLAERLERVVRTARMHADQLAPVEVPAPMAVPLAAVSHVSAGQGQFAGGGLALVEDEVLVEQRSVKPGGESAKSVNDAQATSRPRSQSERDLLRALRGGR